MRIRYTKIPADIVTTKLGGVANGEMEIRLIPFVPNKRARRAGTA